MGEHGEDSDIVTFKLNGVSQEEDGEQSTAENIVDIDSQENQRASETVDGASKIVDLLENRFSRFERHMLDRIEGIERKLPRAQLNRSRCSSPMGIRESDVWFGRGDSFPQNRNENRQFLYPEPARSELNIRERSHAVKMKPQLFDGTGDLDEYLAQFDIVSEINGWDLTQKALYLASSLTGGALSLLNELSPVQRRDFIKVTEVLQNRYGSENRAEIFRSRLQTRVRGRNESIAELANAIRKLTRQAYPGAQSSLIDILSLDHFIDALTDSEIKLRLREARPTNLNAAETLAVRLESYRLADSQRTKSVRIAEIDKSSSSIESVKSDLDGLKRSVTSLAASVDKLARAQDRPHGNKSNQNRRRYRDDQFRERNSNSRDRPDHSETENSNRQHSERNQGNHSQSSPRGTTRPPQFRPRSSQ